MNGKGDQTVNKQFEVKRISTKGAYNAAAYKKSAAEKYEKPLVISFDGEQYPEEKMIEAAKLLCESLNLNSIYLGDQRKDELIEVSVVSGSGFRHV